MNYSTAIFLVNKNVRAVVGVYEDDEQGKKAVPRTVFKTVDETIKVGDYVLVPTNTRHKMSVNKIVEVDVDVDFDSQTQMSWIISPVDRQEYEANLKIEDAAISAIKSAEKRRKQDELRAALIKDNPILESLQIANLGSNAHGDENPVT